MGIISRVKRVNPAIKELEKNDDQFMEILMQLGHELLTIFRRYDSLKEEIEDYDEVYQITIEDLKEDIWIEVKNGEISFNRGIHPDASLRMRFTRNTMLRVLKQEMNGADAYMRGLMKVEGTLTEGFRFYSMVRHFFIHLNEEN